MTKYAILGASGHGKVIADALLKKQVGVDISFFDDAFPKKEMQHWPVVGNCKDLVIRANEFEGIVVAIGNNSIRYHKQSELEQNGARIISIIHPSAIVSDFAQIGKGVVVLAGAVINAGAIIGDACIINSNSVVEHDCDLKAAVHISPGANIAGGVSIGIRSWIGIGSSVKQMIRIGNDVIVGAGSVVIKDILDNLVVAGVPAKPLIGKRTC